MKFVHLSDLHIGKRVNGYSMLEDQADILQKILEVIRAEQPDAVLIAGDVYDKSVPSTEAVELFDEFLVALSKLSLQVFVISGNHDSAERLAFGNRLIAQSGIHLSSAYKGTVESVVLEDEYGQVEIFLLPFVKPAHVRPFFEEEITSYTQAVRTALSGVQLDPTRRNVLVTHQFVTGAARCESEELSVGGTDNVDADVFAGFDYVALGHIHSPQHCGSPQIRYCGTPLKYSFSEAKDEKSVTIVELQGLSQPPIIRTVLLQPLRDMCEIKGTYLQLMERSFYQNTRYQEDYMRITLTDEQDVPDAMAKLRTVYHNLMKLDYDNTRTRTVTEVTAASEVESKTPLELFEEFYQQQNGQPMNEQQQEFMRRLIETVWEDEL